MTDTPRIYIAGPMRSIEAFNFPAFDRARDFLTEEGWEVISPADLDREQGFDPNTSPIGYDFDVAAALRRDFAAICTCEAIAFLPGWRASEGAQAEAFVAGKIGLEFYFVDPDAREFYPLTDGLVPVL